MDKTLTDELKDINGVTIGDVAEAIAKLSDEEKAATIYDTVRADNFEDIRGWSIHWLDYLEANNSEDLKAIVAEGSISDELSATLEKAISSFAEGFDS